MVQVLFSSKKEDWETPQNLFDELNKEPKGFCPQCPDCEGNCNSENERWLKKLWKRIWN